MRKSAALLLLVGLVLAWPVRGQDRPSIVTVGMRPQSVTMKPMDTSRIMTPPQLSRFPQFGSQKPMSGSSFFPKLSLGNWPLRTPTPTFLSGKTTTVPNVPVTTPLGLKK